MGLMVIFFFSSRRRHTRFDCDWSSDVCSSDLYAMGLIDQLLVQGADSRLYQSLVQKRGLTGSVSGGANPLLGNMFDIKGPTLWTVWLIHDADKKADDIISAFDEEITRLQNTPVTREELDLALVKRRSRLYADYEQFVGFGRANLLAAFARSSS